MEIETKIFNIKKIRKVLDKKKIKPERVADIMDFLFSLEHFSPKKWNYEHAVGKKSGYLSLGDVSVEIPHEEALRDIEDFCEKRYGKGSKVRLRLVDTVPYITIKGPKKKNKGIKSREEIETKIGSLSAMMQILLMSGAILEKSIARVRETYHIPHYKHAELVIDRLESAHDALEYAEIECGSEKELMTILEDVFHINPANISDEGVTDLHAKKMTKSVSRRLTALEEMVED